MRSWLKVRKRLTDKDTVIRGVGEDDGIAEQSGSVVGGGGGGGWSRAGERGARGPLRGRCSVSGAGLTELLGFGFIDVSGGWSWDKE